jgi:hypothetical protein
VVSIVDSISVLTSAQSPGLPENLSPPIITDHHQCARRCSLFFRTRMHSDADDLDLRLYTLHHNLWSPEL